MKKFLCLFLTFLLLAASFAVAEGGDGSLPVVELITPEEYNGRLVYIIKGNLFEDAAQTIPFVGAHVKLGISRSEHEAIDFWELNPHVAEYSDLTTDANGQWILRLPVRDNRNEDFLSGYGKTVYLWRKVESESGVSYEAICALQRPDQLPDTAANQEAPEEQKYLVPEYDFGWAANSVTLMIQLLNDDKPFANEDVTLCIKNDTRRFVAGKTDAQGTVTFELSQAMQAPGTELVVIYSKNQDTIVEFTVPAQPEVTPEIITVEVRSGEPAPAPASTPVVPKQMVNDGQIEQPDTLLAGLPAPVVYILCAVFLAGYVVCLILQKNPAALGGKKRGKGV